MSPRTKAFIVVMIFLSIILSIIQKGMCSSLQEDDIVPNEETAIKVAEAIWLPIYGKYIYNSRPFRATLKDGVWIVKGTLKEGKGGVPYAEIQKSDCKVIKVIHTK